MGLIQLYSTSSSTASTNISSDWHERNAAFCNCVRDVNDDKQCCMRRKSSETMPVSACRCGEDTCNTFVWRWDKEMRQPQTMFIGETVSFHPSYSQGTSIIRGDTELTKGHIHYWEIKIVHWFSGTDLMVGIGTDQVNIFEHQYKFSSALGIDGNSWGFSHQGLVQHKSIRKCYGKSYIKQSIVGVYLDLFRGHLEFYVNRIPQGIAYRNIPTDKNTPIYPMVCSTSARSSVRLINASSSAECLQLRCMKVITKYPELIKTIQQMPGLAGLCDSLWYMFPRERYLYKNNTHESSTHTSDELKCIDETKCNTNRCANGTSCDSEIGDCGNRNNCIEYENLNDIVDISDNDHNDSMENDLFAATLHSSGNNFADMNIDDINEMT